MYTVITQDRNSTDAPLIEELKTEYGALARARDNVKWESCARCWVLDPDMATIFNEEGDFTFLDREPK